MDRFTNPDKTPRPERQRTADLPAPSDVPTPKPPVTGKRPDKPEAKAAGSPAAETRRAAPLVPHFGWRPGEFDFPVALVAPSAAALRLARHEAAEPGESTFLSQIEVLSVPSRSWILPRVIAVVVLIGSLTAVAVWTQMRGGDDDNRQAAAPALTATPTVDGTSKDQAEAQQPTATTSTVDDTLNNRRSQPGFGGNLPRESEDDDTEETPTSPPSPTSEIVLPGSGVTVVSAGEGDSLITIAEKFGLDVRSLVWSNDIEDPSASLDAGTNVHVPQEDGVVHVVERGETVRSIAERYGVEPEAITGYHGNGLADGGTVAEGDLLLVPGGVVADRGDIAKYTVREGDTLSQIASYYGLQSQTLVWANELPHTNLIHPGQELIIPPGDGALVTAKDGDSVDTIASRFSVDREDIVNYEFNGLSDGSVLQVNQWVLVPGDFLPEPDTADIPSAEEAAGEGVVGPATGSFLWPTEGWISQEFHSDHNGLDVANDEWTPVNAADGGIVTFAGWSDHGLGYAVAIDHGNGYTTWYGHLAAQPYVEVGQVIWQGGYLGPMGTTGRSTGPHLHFILMKDGVYQNPLDYLG